MATSPKAKWAWHVYWYFNISNYKERNNIIGEFHGFELNIL